MPETIYKLQPDRTVALRGFDSFAAAASIHSATPTGFQVSGTFRDPADFAVAVLYDADDFFEHPSIKYLPDFNFSGLTLSFSLLYSDGLQPIDSPKYNWIDWATLDCVLADGSTAQVRLWDYAMLADSAFPAASASLNILTGAAGVQPNDRLTLWFQNLAFDYIVPNLPLSAEFQFFAGQTGASHSITINGRSYSHTEAAGENSADQATALINAINSPGDPDVVASGGSSSNAVAVTLLPGRTGINISVSASDGNGPATLFQSSPQLVAAALVSEINGTNWIAANTTHALLATGNGAQITIAAAQYGTVNVNGTSVSWVSGTRFSGLTPGSVILIGGTAYSVASVQSPVQLTLTSPCGAASGALYVAPRGGYDGNMIAMYTLAPNSDTLSVDQPNLQFSGGNSLVTWNCSIDFSALQIDQLRQCWLTFAPALTNGAAFSATEWQAVFSNWQLTGPESVTALQVAGPGSVRIEEDDSACVFNPKSSWGIESGFYSKYFAAATSDPNASLTVTYRCQFTHDLYIGTSLYGISDPTAGLPAVPGSAPGTTWYSDRAVAGVSLDGDAVTSLDTRLLTGSALVARRLVRSSVPAGKHTVAIGIQQAGVFYFDYLEAAVRSDVPDNLAARDGISPALDFDTNHTYMLPPARVMWIMDKLGYAGPMNEYLGVFWWNERVAVGGSVSTAQVVFSGSFAYPDSIILTLNGSDLGKSVFPGDTLATIASHFAAYINETFVGTWASAAGGTLTITGRSPAPAYNIALSVKQLNSAQGQVAITPQQIPAGVYPEWVVNDAANPPLNRATRDWHADFYSQCAARSRQVFTSCSMELVNPPDGYVARFPDAARTAVSTATGFGSLVSNHCAIGASKMLAYQKQVYRTIAQMQATAGLVPCVQYGEFLWWYFAGPGGMAYYDDETMAAAASALGRPLYVFSTPNDDPTANPDDALFLRNRLRDHVGSLVADIRSAFPNVQCEVLWPYDVNYPSPVPVENPTVGGQLNRFVNLPVEWQQQATSGLDFIKTEALAFGSSMRNLELARQAIDLFPGFGWPLGALRYLVPVFGSATPWARELALVWGAGLRTANLWAFDHVCLFNLDVPEPALERRSFVKTV